MSKSSVFGIVKTHAQAEQIVQGQQDAGFDASEISVLLPDNEGKHDIGHVKATKAPEGATTGAATGGVTGGVVGGLIGLGIPEIEAKRYENKLKSGNYLIAVHAVDGDEKDTAKTIFKNAGAEDISVSSMSKAPAESVA